MKIRIMLEINVAFDLESDGRTWPESVIPMARVVEALDQTLHSHLDDELGEALVEAATDAAGWCVSSSSFNTAHVEDTKT
jgi:hypothetical protein